MCSCWDRWGSRPSFEVPAKEVVASRGLSTPHCKIFRTQSHWATSLPSVSLQTTLGFDTPGLILSRHTLQFFFFLNVANVYKFTTVQRQWKTAWGLSRCADKNSGDLIYEREGEKERGRRREQKEKKNPQHPTPLLRVSWSQPSEYWDVLCIVVDKSSQIEFLSLAGTLSELIWFYCRDTWLSIRSGSDTALQTRENPSSLLLSPGPSESERERVKERSKSNWREAGTKTSKCEIIHFESI